MINYTELENQVISDVITLVNEKLSKSQADQIIRFINQLYANVPEKELFGKQKIDIYGAVMAFWQMMSQRECGEVKIRVYNPTFEKDGWSSTHTVIEIIQDDMPFLIDTINMELNRLGLGIHNIFHSGDVHVSRDPKTGQLLDVVESGSENSDKFSREAYVFLEIDRQADDVETLRAIAENLQTVLDNVRVVVSDFVPMKNKMLSLVEALETNPLRKTKDDIEESIAFLKWLAADHFTFLGSATFDFKNGAFKLDPKSLLGLAKQEDSEINDTAAEDLESIDTLRLSKSDHKTTVHRSAYMDIISIKKFNQDGEVVSKERIYGLYTSVAYHRTPNQIPLLRKKVDYILKHSNYTPYSHAGKALFNIIDTYPRDELFQASEAELFNTIMDIMQIKERQTIRLYIRRDVYKHYYFCMVFVPRERYNSELRVKMQNILMQELQGVESTFAPVFLESSILSRIDFVIRTDRNKKPVQLDIPSIEAKLVIAARNWRDELKETLVETYGENKGHALYTRHSESFPASYRDDYLARTAVLDIEQIERVQKEQPLAMTFYRVLEEPDDCIRFKLFRKNKPFPLTDVLPILESMGLRVINERPYKLTLKDGECTWISDFGMQVCGGLVDPNEVREIFKEAFSRVWEGGAESDGFNQLVMKIGMPWYEINILRAYSKYLHQIGFRFSQDYIIETLAQYPLIAKQLVSYFLLKFDPSTSTTTDKKAEKIEQDINESLKSVANLDQDKIFNRIKDVINATLRTNYFQVDEAGERKPYVSFKLTPSAVPEMPKPHPMFEVFTYSRRFEGVHLRGGKVARGGIRWSDRKEDFRTEVLGLVKAQQVKNAVIIPVGAKGGFVPKHLPFEQGREAVQQEAIACYKMFISGLLDLTDNLDGKGKIIYPENVKRLDDDDPYLVVAADKGTATFSDIANEVSKQYGFWLDDAFASGGSNGYDHKKMGITAKGAWESVKRHFRELGKDIQKEDFTVVGVGDMSGDVFGNGMLLSKHIRLVAAFNHLHIFVDPNPNAAKTYLERERLFNLPRSTWTDFDEKCMSKGAMIYPRDAKVLKLTPEIKACFDISEDELEPNEFISRLLKAKVDLLWNGGIGTYVKASTENNADVGDRANDNLRVDGRDLKCTVVGEGGNLGFTQLGRIEFAMNGGSIYTDAIDNSAGVDCSDHEVNIKILIDNIVATGDMTDKQRNILLAKMEDEVSKLVLSNNYYQTETINNAIKGDNDNTDIYIRLMNTLEKEGHLDREIEFLPSNKELKARHAVGKKITAPEFSVIMAYCKAVIKRSILESGLPDEPYFQKFLRAEFPVILQEKYAKSMENHYLARDIIATQLTNDMFLHAGISFVHRLYDETGATPSMIARAYVIACEILNVDAFWSDVESFDGSVSASTQRQMVNELSKAIRRMSRWLLRNHRSGLDVDSEIKILKPKMHDFVKILPKILNDYGKKSVTKAKQRYEKNGVPKLLATMIAGLRVLPPALEIIMGAEDETFTLEEGGRMYFMLSGPLELGWFRRSLVDYVSEQYFDTLAYSALKDDLDRLQRQLATSVLRLTSPKDSLKKRLNTWMNSFQHLLDRWLNIIIDLKAMNKMDFVAYSMAIRDLADLAEACTYGAEQYQDKLVHLSV